MFDDAKFKEVFKGTFETCLKDVTEKIADIQKKYEGAPYNIKKDQCNVKFMAVNACSILDGVFKVNFINCFLITKTYLILNF